MSKVVYVVHGSTGEYSDHRAWEVRAFMSKAQAEAMVARLTAWLRQYGLDTDSGNSEWRALPYPKPTPPEDPEFSSDYTGTVYGVMELPLDES